MKALAALFPRGRRLRRALAFACGALLAFTAGGCLYQSISVRRERRSFPPPGSLVDIGGRRLHVICLGAGEPAVIFESAMFGSALSSGAARREIGAQTRVCSYDRAGMGWSDPGPGVISAGMLADDLDRLLGHLGLSGPLILVPASIGGLTAELYARRHPARVAGLVFVDAAQSLLLEGAVQAYGSSSPGVGARVAACFPRAAASVGLLRAVDPMGLRTRREHATAARLYRTEPMATLCAMVRGAGQTVRDLAAAPPLPPDMRLIVLSAASTRNLGPLGQDWMVGWLDIDRIGLAQQFARRSTRGTWQLVPDSDHLIGNSQPHAVAAAVLDLVAEVRGSSLPPPAP